MEAQGHKGSTSTFQMPLHYPRYTRKDYQIMTEQMLDRLLAEYGLSLQGDLASKREFAMGAFLWPEFGEKPRQAYQSQSVGYDLSRSFQTINNCLNVFNN